VTNPRSTRVLLTGHQPGDRKLGKGANISNIRPEQARRTTPKEILYADAFENAPHAMALIAADGAIVHANRSLCRLLGFSKSEICHLNLRDVTHPEDLETDVEQRHRLATADIGRYELVHRCLRKDRTQLWVRVSVSAMRRSGSDPTSFVVQVETVAAQAYSESRASADLLARFSEATLSAMHEIGNCLTPLMLSTEMIVEQTPRGEVHELAEQIFKAARRVALALHRLRPIQDTQPVAYVGQNRLLDLRMVAPPFETNDAASDAGAA
jgi:PAS domain S-box-containing protein